MNVSVIIPVYNAANYIAETLHSVLRQTMQDFEVLLVDDHGQDNSIEIARSVASDDLRFRFLETPVNSGPGIARNIGIEAANGDFIVFLDSDDFWEPNFLESLLQPSKDKVLNSLEKSFDLTYCQLKYCGGKREGQIHRNPVMENGTFTPSAKKYFLMHFVTFSVCFLFRRDFLLENCLRFPGNKNSEDTNFLTRCLLLAETIACVDSPLYIYNVREDSLTTGNNSKRYKERLSALNSLMDDFKVLKRTKRFSNLRLEQYNWAMRFIWLKKGLAQAIKDVLHCLF